MRQGEGTLHYNDDNHVDHEDHADHNDHQEPHQQHHDHPHQRHGFWNKDKLEGMVKYTKGHHTQTEFW